MYTPALPDFAIVSGAGRGFFHSKGSCGCAAREGIPFRTPSLTNGTLFGNFSTGKSLLFAILVRERSNFGNSYKGTQDFSDSDLEKVKICQF